MISWRPWLLFSVGVVLGLPLVCGGCGAEAEPAPWLRAVHVVGDVRLGTPVIVVGDGLRGLQLRLEGPAGAVTVALSSRPDPGMLPDVVAAITASWTHGHVTSAPAALPTGAALTRACLVHPIALDADRRCVPIATVSWRSGPLTDGPPRLVGASTVILTHGRLAGLAGATIPLPGEGTATLEVEVRRASHTSTVRRSGVLPWPVSGDRGGRVLVTPALLGTQLGAADVRLRLQRAVQAGADSTAWSAWQPVHIVLPPLAAQTGSDVTLERGQPVPGTQSSASWPVVWRGGPRLVVDGLGLGVVGQWRDGQGAVAAEWVAGADTERTLPVRGTRGAVAVLASTAWFVGGWDAHVSRSLVGEMRWVLVAPGDAVVHGPPVALHARLRHTVQRVAVRVSASTRAGLARYGLANLNDTLVERVRALVQGHFLPWSVDVRVLAETQPFIDGSERVTIALLDRDPNGIGLLGNDPSVGKDSGNHRLDERLDGTVDFGGHAVGQPAYGGVFLSGFLLLSPTLNPGGLLVDPAFDLIFSPFSPSLGGAPATDAAGTAAAAALEALAQLVAGTVSHELGHTLGLAAADGYHHSHDNPGWRMDAGTARPFSERANLPGSGGEIWGPVDSAYLHTILPRDAD